MATDTIFSSSLFQGIIFPFALVFVLVFAILDKSKLLGEGKRQINAIVSLVIALIFVSFSRAVGIVVGLMPFLAVMLVIILVFYLMIGFVFNNEKAFTPNRGIKIAGGIIVFVALLIAVAVVTGYWDKILSLLQGGGTLASTIIMLAVIGGALAVVLGSDKKT